jgi:DNA end-binding protein Ku
MQNPIWKGNISFGLVSISVALYSAEKRFDLHFHLLDSRDKARIHYARINDETGKEVPWDQIVKGYEYNKNNYVILKPEDFKRAAPEVTKTIEIKEFVNSDEIDYIYFDKPYYLIPEKSGEKGYVLLREGLKKENKTGIGKVVIREKEYLAAVMAKDDALILHLLRFYQEVKQADEFILPQKPLKSYHISEKEIKMAQQLIDGMTEKWKPESYHDDYRDALRKWIEDKYSHGKKVHVEKKEEEPVMGKTLDFMAALKKSLKDVKKESSKVSSSHKHKTMRRRHK